MCRFRKNQQHSVFVKRTGHLLADQYISRHRQSTHWVREGSEYSMKKIGLFAIATAFVALFVGASCVAAHADNYTIALLTPGIGTFTQGGGTFSFTTPSPAVDFYDTTTTTEYLGALNISGDVSGGVASNVVATFSGFTSPTILTGGSGLVSAFGPIAFVGASNGSQLTFSATDVNAGGSFNSGGGSYTPAVTPEASSVVALAAVLALGGLVAFGAKRRSSSMVA
jgi:hypothetical protein